MRSARLQSEMPPWALPAAVAAGVLFLVVVGWRVFTGHDSAGPPIQVHPGQYDLRAEVAKMRAAREAKTNQNGP